MRKKINLSVYRFSLLNKVKEQQVLSFFNEEEDLLDTMDDFCGYIHKNIRDYIDNQGKYRTFTLSNLQKKILKIELFQDILILLTQEKKVK